MKRFRFSQENLRRLKDQQRHQAEGRLWQARHRLEETRGRLQRLDADLSRLAALPATPARATRAAGWLWCRWASQLQAERQTLQQQLMDDSTAYQQAREQLRQIETETESLQSLRSLRWREYRKEVGLQAQREMDAVAVSRWMNGRGVGQQEGRHDV